VTVARIKYGIYANWGTLVAVREDKAKAGLSFLVP
jgi:hypothetical protein